MESQKPPQKMRINPIWWVVMLVLLAWNVYAFWPHGQPQISLPYSSFIDQVKVDHVKAVQITGSSIKGEFNQPLPILELVPLPTPLPDAAAEPA
jgi:hypothetical protein